MKTQNKKQIEKTTILVLLVLTFSMGLVYAEGVTDAEVVSTLDKTVCCEKTNAGLFCQDVPEEDCSDANGLRQLPTSCESTSFCKPGFCYDSTEGTCLDNVPQLVCNDNNGTWSEEKPEACNLGCCVLGDQASFVTLVRCKRLSSFYGLDTNWNSDIQSEPLCILTARAEERGACVFEEEFETTCKMTTRSECEDQQTVSNTGTQSTNDTETTDEDNSPANQNTNGTDGNDSVQTSPGAATFNPGMLCTAEELNTNCGQTEDTICLPGREEVYFVDTCGNPANIYDASKIHDSEYWTYIKDKSESCKADESNENSQTCGNCNYLLGSYCSASKSGTARATYGDNICESLNCEYEGETKLHGESWCLYDEEGFDFSFNGPQEAGSNPIMGIVQQAIQDVSSGAGCSTDFLGASGGKVGSKFYRLICSHGEVLSEPCADFRQEECIENDVAGYSEAACRVNRWQDCTSQFTKDKCEDYDRRDCTWLEGIEYVLMGGLANGSAIDKSSLANAGEELKKFKTGERELGACVPRIPPGLKFYGSEESEEEAENTEATSICSQANAICPVTYEKGLVGGDWECIENCQCLASETQVKRSQLCMSLGDCGPKTNFIDVKGSGKGFKIFEEDLKKKD